MRSKKITQPLPYAGTVVAVEKSQQEISKLLQKHGMEGVMYGDNFKTNEVLVRFARVINGTAQSIRLQMKIQPSLSKKPDQGKKATYRMLFYWLKGQFDAIDCGLMSFEQAFLGHIEWHTAESRADGYPGSDEPQPRTTTEILLPLLQSGISKFPALKG